jgi:glutaconate CoA-transferase subunit A
MDFADLIDIDTLVAQIADGDLMALPAAISGPYSSAAMSATRALIRRGVKRLHLLGVPALSYQADLLIGAGCVGIVEAGSVLMYEYGPANRFVVAQKSGAIELRDNTCPAIQAALVAGEKGIPFMPVRGIIGSDLLVLHQRIGDWALLANPFGKDDPIVAIGAIRPDVALFAAPLADRHGNVWIGARVELQTVSRAAKKTLVTVEEIYEGDLMSNPELAPGTLPATFVTAVSHQPNGSWPLGAGSHYGEDVTHLREYARLAKTDEGFAEYLAQHIIGATELALV